MVELITWSVIFVISLVALVKSSDFFTGAAEQIGIMLGISPFVVGVTIVATGTSLPELISSIVAVLDGATEIVTGNVLGSNVANIFLIFGVAAIVGRSMKFQHNMLPVDLPLMMGSALFTGMAIWDGRFSLGEAVIFIACYLIYTLYLIFEGQAAAKVHRSAADHPQFAWKPVVVLLVSGLAMVFGAKYTISSVIRISEILDVGKELIAVSAIAIGTSLPELAVSVSAVRKKNVEIAMGNVVGSNIFNCLAVLGVPGLFGALEVPSTLITIAMPVMIIATILFFVVTVDRRVSKWEGWLFFLFYGFFLGKTFHIL